MDCLKEFTHKKGLDHKWVLAEKLGTDENEDMILQSVPLSICMLFEQNLLLENVQKACGFGPQLTKRGNPSTIGG